MSCKVGFKRAPVAALIALGEIWTSAESGNSYVEMFGDWQ